MSKSKVFSETTASRYSLALFELAQETKCLEEVETQCNFFINLIKECTDFHSLIKDPTNKIEDLVNVINSLSDRYKINRLLTKFINYLIFKRRFFYIESILKDFIETCSKKRGEIKAELSSAKDLNVEEINSIKDELNNNFKSKIKLEFKHDPNLIGGLKLKVGSVMFDASIENKLKKIENNMSEV